MSVNLFETSPSGSIFAINKSVFEEGRELIQKLKRFQNSSLHSATQLIEQVNRDELVSSISKVHSKSIEDQFVDKLDIIEKSVTASGDFIIIVDSEIDDNRSSMSSIILHISRTQESGGAKIYDCLMHSVVFNLRVSLAKIGLCTIGTLGATVGALLFGGRHGGQLALVTAMATTSASLLHVQPVMPEYVEKALAMILVETLHSKGYLIEQGSRFILKIPPFLDRLSAGQPEVSASDKHCTQIGKDDDAEEANIDDI